MNYTKNPLASSCIKAKNDATLIVPLKNQLKASCDAGSVSNDRAVIHNNYICSLKEELLEGNKTRSKSSEKIGRRHITSENTFIHNNRCYLINNKTALLTDYLNRSLDELDASLRRWKRVLTVRVDLRHSGITYADNKIMTKFMRKLRKALAASHKIDQFGYSWVREHEPDKSQHYHMVLYLDGDKVRTSHRIAEMVKAIWGRINPVHDVIFPERPYLMIKEGWRDVEEVRYKSLTFETNKDSFVYRLSYLAKAKGKVEGMNQSRVKSWSTSRLATK